MLDGAADSAGMEELADEVDGGAFGVSGVSVFLAGLPTVTEQELCVCGPENYKQCTTYRLLWGISGTMFGIYAIVQNLNIPLIVQPQLLSLLSYLSWAQVRLSQSILAL